MYGRDSDIGLAPLLEPLRVRDREVVVLERFPLPVPLPPPQAVLALLRKLILLLPVVIAPRVMQLLDEMLDAERTPPWKRALLASILLEVLAAVQVQVSAAAALRCLLLGTLFSADKRQREREDDRRRGELRP